MQVKMPRHRNARKHSNIQEYKNASMQRCKDKKQCCKNSRIHIGMQGCRDGNQQVLTE